MQDPPDLPPQLAAVLDTAPDATLVTDRLGAIVLANPQADALFGFGRGELLGMQVELLIPERFRARHPGHRNRYFLDPKTRPMGSGGLQLVGLRKDGTEFFAEISLSPLETHEGPVAITAIRDVTDRKRAEEERSRLHAQLESLLEDQNRFFTNVSHELRTPLALVLGPVEKLLQTAEPGSAMRADLEVAARNARTLLRHVNDLLDVAKLEAGRMGVDLAEVDVARLVRVVASHFEVVAQDRRMALSVEAPDALRRTLDASKFQRVLLNLLSNAFKFTPGGGKIRCTLRPAAGGEEPAGGIVLEVADSGPGIPREHRESVFLRFRQLDEKARSGGTGLGLAIAKEFVTLHGGRIDAGDAPEGGASFKVVLPRLEPSRPAWEVSAPAEDDARDVAEALRPRSRPASAPRPGEPVVLVVEDNPEMSAYIRDVLAPDASIFLAEGGREGFQRALALRPDVIVTDLMMAGGGGEELVHAVRSRDELEDVPIVILTAKADDRMRVRLLGAGAQDYVMKPFSADELRARVMGLLATKRARDVMRRELDSQTHDVETLARELTSRKRELEAALDIARAARDEAARSSRVKSDFLSLISHELRTPITALQLQVERLARDPDGNARQRIAVPRLMAASRRLTALVDGLLEHARVAGGRVTPHRNRVDLAELVREAVEETKPQIELKGLSLRLELPGDLPPVVTDAGLVRVVVSNLLENAVKFTSSGTIVVRIVAASGEQRVAVSDSGPGIPEADRDRIFEPFEQLDPIAMKHFPGVGLGLALVRELCAALGARVELRSALGAGSTFTVVLPDQLVDQPGNVVGSPTTH
jgi:PAS domain S-box-containing protein